MPRTPKEQGKRNPAGRSERLATALRENLRKRKMQARGRSGQPDETAGRRPERDAKREP
jgi:hypothetical protein